ncbi:DUF4168 domain-containing protein [Mesonia sp. K7]|uniref:DUF4168 domain-containing protein n=1 Tax=Mesonia sp. K7 TaxID=2218606 RepID=UPI000DA8AEE8|nr:DUF4168 domain-containing protein [Mesonia sp. K7]PZD77012.1 hypothetical protein DNG35_10245 [Mesonia sp. K7]
MRKFKSLFVAIALMAGISSFAQEVKPVSDAELNTFVEVFSELQAENQSAQKEMIALMEAEGLTLARFQAIQQAQATPDAEIEYTEAEKAKYDKIIAAIQRMQPALQAKMAEVVKEKGLSMQRYQEIGTQIQTKPELQQKIQDKMMKAQTQM